MRSPKQTTKEKGKEKPTALDVKKTSDLQAWNISVSFEEPGIIDQISQGPPSPWTKLPMDFMAFSFLVSGKKREYQTP